MNLGLKTNFIIDFLIEIGAHKFADFIPLDNPFILAL